jgi:hypothetical protein
MKTIASIFAVMLVAASALATGVSGLNTPQSGVFTYTAATGLSATNTFNPAFTVTPIITAYASATNAGTPTITATTSNLIITTSGTVSTNYTVNWLAQYGNPLVQTGTATLTPSVLSTNTFTTPYGVAPVVTVSGDSIAATGQVAVVSVSTSTVILESAATNHAQWHAIGRSIVSGVSPVTQ